MKICPSCSAENEDARLICQDCGHSLPQPEGPGVGGGRKIGMIAGITAAVIAALVLAVKIVPALFATPDQKFLQYHGQWAAERLLAGLEPWMEGYETEGFSSDLTITANADDPEAAYYLEGSAVNLKMDLRGEEGVVEAQATLRGQSLFQGFFTYSRSMVGFYLPQADENYYIMDVTWDQTEEGEEPLELTAGERRELEEDLQEILHAAINEGNVTREKGRDFRLPRQEADCRGEVYTYAPTGEDVACALEELALMMEENQALRRLFWEEGGAVSLMNAIGREWDSGASYEENLDQALREVARSFRTLAKEAEGEELDFTWKLWVSEGTVRMIRIDAFGESLTYERTGEADKGEDGCWEKIYGTDGTGIDVWTRKEGSVYRGKLAAEDAFILSYEMDTNRRSPLGIPQGSYELEMETQGETFRLELTVEPGGDGCTDHIFVFRGEPDVPGQFNRLEAAVSATDESSARPPQLTPVDITNYSDEERQAIFQKLWQNLVQGLLSIDLPQQGTGPDSAEGLPSPDFRGELEEDVREAYLELIGELEREGELKYNLVDLDGDDTPELTAASTGYWVSLYTYADGQVYPVMENWPYGAMGNHGYEYLPGKNVIRNYNADLAGAILWIGYFQMGADRQMELCFDEPLSMWMFRDLNENYSMDEGEYVENPDGTYETYFYYGERELTAEEFDSYQIEGDYQWLEGIFSAREIAALLDK